MKYNKFGHNPMTIVDETKQAALAHKRLLAIVRLDA
jgi:hypothetical protein